jgi:hypothetical protein
MRILPLLLLAGCIGGTTEQFTFVPHQASAMPQDFGPNVYVYATELNATALGYPHPPRSLYITLPNENGRIAVEEHATQQLPPHVGTMRMTEHQEQPRLYIVERGHVDLVQTANSYLLSLDVTMVDPLDAVRVHVASDFLAPTL